jgi:hypothetical protein
LIWVIDLDIVWDFHINIDLSHWPWHCAGFSYKYWFESLTLTLSRSMTQINIYVKIPHNVKVNHSNQYLYENPIQCQGQWLKSIFITLCGIFTLILIWVIDDLMWDFHINIDLSHWPWHCVGFSHKYWFESLTLTLCGILTSILIWVLTTKKLSRTSTFLVSCLVS